MGESASTLLVETVPNALAGERVDRVVSFMTSASRTVARTLVEAGAVAVDGTAVRSGKVRLDVGQVVSVDVARLPVSQLPQPDADVEFDVVYADDSVIVVDKPAGLVVHPGPGHPDNTLVNGLLARFPEISDVGEPHRPGVVHRLDGGTSGLMVVARSDDAATHLINQFADHAARREYCALVWGSLDAEHAVIDAPIGRSPRDPLRMAVIASGRWARTEYTVQRRFDTPADATLVSCELETGRTHQIRVHLNSINHPIVGDPLYGQPRADVQLDRPFLHARRLTFTHPGTGAEVCFERPLPTPLERVLETFGNSRPSD